MESFCFLVHFHEDGSCKLLKTFTEKLSSKIQSIYTITALSTVSVRLISRRQPRYRSCSRLVGPRGRISPAFPSVSNMELLYLHKNLQGFIFHNFGNLTLVIFVTYALPLVSGEHTGMNRLSYSLLTMPVPDKDLLY